MTEKAKMLNGELYDSSDKQLVDELIKAKKLCTCAGTKFNDS